MADSTLPAPFQNTRSFRAAFIKGLGDMLRHDELGVFILVLANATFEKEIYHLLQRGLRDRFEQIAGRFRDALAHGHSLHHAADDVLVFLKLMAIGFDNLHMTEFRKVGPLELQFNQLRAFRPPRMSNASVTSLQKPFDAEGFHFNKPFLAKEVFWQGELCGHDCRLLYNKFPFAELHGLLVLDAEAEKPQWLSQQDHFIIWQIVESIGVGIPRVGLGYNAYGAYASVNHQHLQMYVRDRGCYPVESAQWRHNGGEQDFPVGCLCFKDADSAWGAIARLHAAGRSYNLLYRPGALYVMPRALQGSYQNADWTSGFAWSELAGAITTFRASAFEGLQLEQLLAEYQKLRVDSVTG